MTIVGPDGSNRFNNGRIARFARSLPRRGAAMNPGSRFTSSTIGLVRTRSTGPVCGGGKAVEQTIVFAQRLLARERKPCMLLACDAKAPGCFRRAFQGA